MNLILSVVVLLHSRNAHAADYCYPTGAMCGAKQKTNNLQVAIDNTCTGEVFVNGTPVVPNTRKINSKVIMLLGATAAKPCKFDGAAAPVISMAAAAADAPLLQVKSSILIIDGVSLAGGHNQSANGGTGTGGNLFVDVGSTLFIKDASVTGGTADLGGGIYAEDQSNVYLSAASVEGNVAVSPSGSGAGAGHGGGIYMIDSNLLMDPLSSIGLNEADFNGGGLAITRNKDDAPEHMVQNVDGNVSHAGDGGGVHASDASMCLFRNEHNEALAGNGGGAFFTGTSGATPIYWSLGPTTENYAAGMGGGHYVDLGDLYVSSGEMKANASSESGGGIRATGALTDVFLQRSLVISENMALVDGGGIHADAGARIVLPFEGPLEGTPGVELEYWPDAVIEPYTCDDGTYLDPTSINDNLAGHDGRAPAFSTVSVGGGVFLDDATLEMDDSFDENLIELELARNIAHAKGGAVAMTGGAKFLTGGDENVVVATENAALGVGTGRGGAFDIVGEGTSAELFRGTIDNNEAASGVGGGVSITEGGSLYLESGSISGNTSESGGGIYVHEGDATLGDDGCSIPAGELTCLLMDGNLATDPLLGGGGIASADAGSLVARQLLMTNNDADIGAAIVAYGSADVHEYTNVVVTDNGGGAGVWAVDVSAAGAALTCTHCTIAHNDDNGIQGAGTVALRNSIVTMHPLGSNVGATVDTTDCNKINTTNVRDVSHAFPGLPFGAGAASVTDQCAGELGDPAVDILGNIRPVGVSSSPYDPGAYEKP